MNNRSLCPEHQTLNISMGGSSSKEEEKKEQTVVQNNGSFYSVDIHWPSIIATIVFIVIGIAIITCCLWYIRWTHKWRRRRELSYVSRHSMTSPQIPQLPYFNQFPSIEHIPMLRYHAWNHPNAPLGYRPHQTPMHPIGHNPRFVDITDQQQPSDTNHKNSHGGSMNESSNRQGHSAV